MYVLATCVLYDVHSCIYTSICTDIMQPCKYKHEANHPYTRVPICVYDSFTRVVGKQPCGMRTRKKQKENSVRISYLPPSPCPRIDAYLPSKGRSWSHARAHIHRGETAHVHPIHVHACGRARDGSCITPTAQSLSCLHTRTNTCIKQHYHMH